MKKSRSSILCIALLGVLLSCTSPNDIVDYTEDLAVADPAPGTTPGYSEDKNAVSYTHLTLPTILLV